MTPPTRPAARTAAARCLGAVLLALAAALAVVPQPAAAQTPDAPAAGGPGIAKPTVDAAAGILVDADSGAVIWARNGHQPRSVASTTKILTALVAEDTFEPDQKLTVPPEAPAVEGSKVGVETGMTFTRDDLLAALLLVSGNDVAETFAANHPAGRAGFLQAMQATCELLGCTDSTWRDPSGLDAPGHQASAADLAVVARALLARPFLAELVASPTYPITWPDGHTQVLDNHNKMVRYQTDPGTIGVKTGYTDKAGHTLVSAQRRGDRTLIAVVLDAADHYAAVRTLFDYGFAVEVPEGAEVLGLTPEDIEQAVAEEAPGDTGGDPARAAEPAGAGGVPVPLLAGLVSVLLLGVGGTAVVVARRARGARA